MEKQYDLDRFLEAQQQTYENALREIREGKSRRTGCGLFFRS
jgi:uncharacterized protein (DUF1810 family)